MQELRRANAVRRSGRNAWPSCCPMIATAHGMAERGRYTRRWRHLTPLDDRRQPRSNEMPAPAPRQADPTSQQGCRPVDQSKRRERGMPLDLSCPPPARKARLDDLSARARRQPFGGRRTVREANTKCARPSELPVFLGDEHPLPAAHTRYAFEAPA